MGASAGVPVVVPPDSVSHDLSPRTRKSSLMVNFPVSKKHLQLFTSRCKQRATVGRARAHLSGG
jgi:hypothetical protein